LPGLHPVLTATDLDRLAADQGIGDLGATPLEHAADGLSGDAHGLGRSLVAQALEVHEADRLELVHGQPEPVELPCRYSGGLEKRDARDARDRTFNRRAWHGLSGSLLAYAHNRGILSACNPVAIAGRCSSPACIRPAAARRRPLRAAGLHPAGVRRASGRR